MGPMRVRKWSMSLLCDLLVTKSNVGGRVSPRVSSAKRHRRTGSSRKAYYAIIFVASALGQFRAEAAQSEVIKEGEFGAWSLYCEQKQTSQVGRCTLVQSVIDEGGNPRAWAKGSLELAPSRDIVLTIRVDRSVQTEEGMAIRIDKKLLGISSFFECDAKYCRSSIQLSSNGVLNEPGTAIEFGKTLDVDIKLSSDAGARIPMALEGVRKGIFALYGEEGQFKSGAWLSSERNELPPSSLIGPSGVIPIEKASFTVDTMRVKHGYDLGNDDLRSNGFKEVADYTKLFAESCPQDLSLSTNITVGADFTLSEDAKQEIKEIITRSASCAGLKYYVVRDANAGLWRDAAKDLMKAELAELVLIQQQQVVRALEEAGIPRERVLASDAGGKILFAVPDGLSGVSNIIHSNLVH
jgi:invasion protein IalB